VSAAGSGGSADALLEVRDLEVEYARGTGAVRVLDDVTLTISPGESLGVVGESGVGKTVLVRAILGLLDPPWRVVRGTVSYRGLNLLAQPEAALQQLRGKEIALTTHEPRKHLNPVATIGDQMARVVQAHPGHLGPKPAPAPSSSCGWWAFPTRSSGCWRIRTS